MKCWKCGQEIADGASVCIYCGASQSRPAPTTAAGRAMRKLYDRCGAQEVLSNSAYLTSGLGDVLEDSKKLRNQLKMAMDCGIGRLYLEQLNAGAPDDGFDRRVKILLTENAGLNDASAAELMRYFDEMIGWRASADPQPKPQPPPQAGRQKVNGSDEIDRSGQYAAPGPEISRNNPNPNPKPAPQPAPKEKIGWKDYYLYEKALILFLLATLVLSMGNFVNPEHDPANYADFAVSAIMLIPLLLSFGVTRDNIRRDCSNLIAVLMIVVGLLAVGLGLDILGSIRLINKLKANGSAMAMESYEWQMHGVVDEVIVIATSIPLLLQMFRHRKMEAERDRAEGK